MKRRIQKGYIAIMTWSDLVRALHLFTLPYAHVASKLDGYGTIEPEKDGISSLRLELTLSLPKLSRSKPAVAPISEGKP